jgi:hypothetical protein
MAQESERPRPHGDPMQQDDTEPNAAQRNSDATPDIANSDVAEEPIDSGSTANGIRPSDEDDGRRRRKQYDEGAELVSRID